MKHENKTTRRVVRATRFEFELDDGMILPLVPNLDHDPSVSEVQESYDRACLAIKSIQDVGDIDKNDS